MAYKPLKQRGRPRFDDDLLRQIQRRFPEIKTRLGRQNAVYMIEAYEVLKDIPETDFLWTYDKAGNWNGMKRKLVTAIGRFQDVELIRKIGIQVCKEQKYAPKNGAQWTEMLRKVRLEKNVDPFLKGEFTRLPYLALKESVGRVGIVKLGMIVELPAIPSSQFFVRIEGKLPAGWMAAELLADSSVATYQEYVPDDLIYTALYRTARVYFKVSWQVRDPVAIAEILGEDLQKPGSEVKQLYNGLGNCHTRLRPFGAKDRQEEIARQRINFQAQQFEKAMSEERHYDPLTHFSG